MRKMNAKTCIVMPVFLLGGAGYGHNLYGSPYRTFGLLRNALRKAYSVGLGLVQRGVSTGEWLSSIEREVRTWVGSSGWESWDAYR